MNHESCNNLWADTATVGLNIIQSGANGRGVSYMVSSPTSKGLRAGDRGSDLPPFASLAAPHLFLWVDLVDLDVPYRGPAEGCEESMKHRHSWTPPKAPPVLLDGAWSIDAA